MPHSSRGRPSALAAMREACAKAMRRRAIARATAPRSRGPPRPNASRASARARSGAAFSSSRRSCRKPRLVGEIGDRVEPRIHRRRIGQRAAEPAGKLARAGGGDGAVDGGEQAAGARALVRAHQLEIGARGGVDDEQAAGALLARRAEQRRSADLGDLDISEQPGERRKLRPGEFAERIERGHAEPRLEGPLAALRIEMGARAWRQRGAGLLDQAAQRGIAGEIVADQHLARLQPRKLAGKIARRRPTRRSARRSRCRARRARSPARRPAWRARGTKR